MLSKVLSVVPPVPVTVKVATSDVSGEFVAGVAPVGPSITTLNLYPVIYDRAVNEYVEDVAPLSCEYANPPSVDLNH